MLINTLPARLVRWFSEQEELADCVFLEAYPGNPAKRPVNVTTVTVGSADLTVAPTEQGAQSAGQNSDSRWGIVNEQIAQLERATTAQELTAILNGDRVTVVTSQRHADAAVFRRGAAHRIRADHAFPGAHARAGDRGVTRHRGSTG